MAGNSRPLWLRKMAKGKGKPKGKSSAKGGKMPMDMMKMPKGMKGKGY